MLIPTGTAWVIGSRGGGWSGWPGQAGLSDAAAGRKGNWNQRGFRAGGWGAEAPGPGVEPASLKDTGFGAKDRAGPLLSEAPGGVLRPPEAGWRESLRFIVIIPFHRQFSSPQSCYRQWSGDLKQPIGPQSLSCTTLRAPEPHTDAHTKAPH